MVETLLAIGIVASIFVGFNIGGSSTGIAWGPPVGAGIVKKTTAAALMTFFVFLGGWTVGRNVMDTLSEGIITIDLTLSAGVAVLFFYWNGHSYRQYLRCACSNVNDDRWSDSRSRAGNGHTQLCDDC